MLITLLNAAKPAVVDDTAYLLFARHITQNPLDPYSFELFWYSRPQPAMQILLPPVVPYWLAAGIAIFGEKLLLLKLWLFPFVLMFCHASHCLLRRFAHGWEDPALALLCGSPFVLPFLNVMLDVPAIALGLSAVAVFIHACRQKNWSLVVLAGALAGLAVQTKYTMLVVPAVLGWYGLLHRRVRESVAAGIIAAVIFIGWEVYLDRTHGTSHFLYHLHDQGSDGGGLERWFAQKSALWRPLFGFLGGLAGAWGLLAARAVGFPRRLVAAVGTLAVLGILAVCTLPSSATVPRTLDLPANVFYPLGGFTFIAVITALAILGFRQGARPGRWIRQNRESWFLIGWFAIELAAYFALTPFPAGRRVLALCVVFALVTARLLSRIRRGRPDRVAGRWVLVFGIGCGLGLFALDWWDSLAEKELVSQADRVVGGNGGSHIWTQGHWGWQYYADREGWTLVAPGRSRLRAGDWLVLPVGPEGVSFYRPHHGFATFRIPPGAVERVHELEWCDRLPARTIPTLYGGTVPVVRGSGPRLKVAVYRVTRDWTPEPD